MPAILPIKEIKDVSTNRRNRIQVQYDPEEGRTEQHHARSCDINTIMMRYIKTGVIDHINKYEPQYGDVSSADFQAAQNLVAGVKTEFEELPAYVRNYYEQDSNLYLEAMSSPEGVEELRSIPHPSEAYTRDGSPDTEALTPSESEETASNPSPTPEEN